MRQDLTFTRSLAMGADKAVYTVLLPLAQTAAAAMPAMQRRQGTDPCLRPLCRWAFLVRRFHATWYMRHRTCTIRMRRIDKDRCCSLLWAWLCRHYPWCANRSKLYLVCMCLSGKQTNSWTSRIGSVTLTFASVVSETCRSTFLCRCLSTFLPGAGAASLS